ncbi:MAG: indole-3-glycerol-phosphate synthase [Gammaproteobacteria bacterium]|jgi:indole-3-glycerol phosphate synthase|nr:indole-3-glycerol-phosphate synthase [Gammaproteobacteria bacterium]
MSIATAPDFLQEMAVASRRRDAAARQVMSDAQLRSQLLCVPPPRPLRLQPTGFDIIAEIKKRSPAEGDLGTLLQSPAEQGAAYASGGAAALSVLTEPERFSGDLDDLQAVSNAVPHLPVMRKDFLVSRYQVREARLAGASGVLLIAAMLSADELEPLFAAAFELDMFVLLEVFTAAELDACLPVLERLGPAADPNGQCRYLLGVNCRNLRTLQVDFAHFARVRPHLPAGIPWVAESGLQDADQATELAALGYRLALVGTTLMRSPDPAAQVARLRAAGTAACS